jgi:hypothetical protein
MFLLSLFYLNEHLKIRFDLITISKIFLANLLLLIIFIFIDSLNLLFSMKIILIIITGLFYLVLFIFLKLYTEDEIEIIIYFANKSPIFKKQIKYIAKLISKHTKKI